MQLSRERWWCLPLDSLVQCKPQDFSVKLEVWHYTGGVEYILAALLWLCQLLKEGALKTVN